MSINKNNLAYSLLFFFIFLFILIVLKGIIIAQPGDENVYYYMGKMISEGKVPYRDFFFAHPPLHIYLIALVYKIFGFNIIALKSIPLISTLITAFFIFEISKEKFGKAEAVASSFLFLFSYSIMFNSVFSFGIEIATMFLVIGVYFLLNRNNPLLSGILFGIAGITRLLSLIPISILIIAALFSNKKNFLKLLAGFFIIFLLVNGIFILFFDDAYFSQVYKFHFLKNSDTEENFKEYIDTVKLDWILFLSAFSFIFVKEKKPAGMFAAVSIVYIIFLMALKRVFGFYFIIVIPFLAMIGGYSIIKLLKRFKMPKKAVIAVSLALFSIFVWNLASDILFLEKVGFVGFERGKDLTDFVNSASSKNTLLFGDESVVPLLALLTNKKIALDFVDTNNQVFISGIKDLAGLLSDLKGKDILFIIRSKQGISYFKGVKEFLDKNCEFVSQFHDKIEGDYLIYRCR